MSPVCCPAADPLSPFLRMVRKRDPRDGEKQTPRERGVEPRQSIPLRPQGPDAQAPQHSSAPSLPAQDSTPSRGLSQVQTDYSRQDEVFRRESQVSAQGQLHTWVLPHTIMCTFPFLDTLFLPHPLHNPLDLQSVRNYGTTLFHQGLGRG